MVEPKDAGDHPPEDDFGLSISGATKGLYVTFFLAQVALAMVWVGYQEIVKSGDTNWGAFDYFAFLFAMWEGTEPTIVTSGAVALLLTEAGRFTLILADAFERRIHRKREAQRQQALREGRHEMYAEFMDWHERRTAAREAGEPFDEPMPMPEEFDELKAARDDLRAAG